MIGATLGITTAVHLIHVAIVTMSGGTTAQALTVAVVMMSAADKIAIPAGEAMANLQGRGEEGVAADDNYGGRDAPREKLSTVPLSEPQAIQPSSSG